MRTVDFVAVFLVALAVFVLITIIARQRYMLRVGGAIPLAVRCGESRWVYGVARYVGGELRWYRSIGIGTRPSRVFARADLTVIGHRQPTAAELQSLPVTSVIVECQELGQRTHLALGLGAFTGLSSWLEASAPKNN